MAKVIDQIAAIDGADQPDAQFVITRDLLALVARSRLDLLEATQYQIAVDHVAGIQTTPATIAQFQPADTSGALERFLIRLMRYPYLVRQEIVSRI